MFTNERKIRYIQEKDSIGEITMNRFVFITGLALLALSEASFAAKKIAVLETTGDASFSKNEKQYVTDKIRERAVTNLPSSQDFEVMTRDGILALLPPGKSLEKCEGKCLTEIGKKISADYVCQAKINQVFGSYAVNIELYETTNGKLMGSFTQKKASIDALLADIEKESDRLFKAIAPQKGNIEKNGNSQTASEKNTAGYVEDMQGNKYRTVTIRKQTWMAENMRMRIENSSCYDNDKKNCEKYGRLYSWEDAKKICPTGWSLPKKFDYEILMDIEYDKLKSTAGWSTINNANGNGTDNYKFSVLPGGYDTGMFSDIGKNAYFWTSTPRSDGYAWYLEFGRNSSKFASNSNSVKMSVRCIKNP